MEFDSKSVQKYAKYLIYNRKYQKKIKKCRIEDEINVFDKPNDQSQTYLNFGMARKRGCKETIVVLVVNVVV